MPMMFEEIVSGRMISVTYINSFSSRELLLYFRNLKCVMVSSIKNYSSSVACEP